VPRSRAYCVQLVITQVAGAVLPILHFSTARAETFGLIGPIAVKVAPPAFFALQTHAEAGDAAINVPAASAKVRAVILFIETS